MDQSTPNLPSRNFDTTVQFYGTIGFTQTFRNDSWLILRKGTLVLEFFPHPKLNPEDSWFSCCLRLDDVDAFFKTCVQAGIAETTSGHPRVHAPRSTDGLYIGALLDPDGSLLRFIST